MLFAGDKRIVQYPLSTSASQGLISKLSRFLGCLRPVPLRCADYVQYTQVLMLGSLLDHHGIE